MAIYFASFSNSTVTKLYALVLGGMPLHSGHQIEFRNAKCTKKDCRDFLYHPYVILVSIPMRLSDAALVTRTNLILSSLLSARYLYQSSSRENPGFLILSLKLKLTALSISAPIATSTIRVINKISTGARFTPSGTGSAM